MSNTISKILEIPLALLSGCPPLFETLKAIPPAIDSDFKTAVRGLDEFKKYREEQCKRLGHSPYATAIKLNESGFARFADTAPKTLNSICDIAFEVDQFTKLVQQNRETAITQKDSLQRINQRLNGLVKTLEDEINDLRLCANTGNLDLYLIHARQALNDTNPNLEQVEKELTQLKAVNPPQQSHLELMQLIREACYLKAAAAELTLAYEKLPLKRTATADPLPCLQKSLLLLQKIQAF